MKKTMKKLLSGFMIIVLLATVVTLFGACSKAENAMEKALETNDITTVLQTYDEYCDSPEDIADMQAVLCEFINNATNTLNRDFKYDPNKDNVEDAITEFVSMNWGTIFCRSDGSVSALWELTFGDESNLSRALENFSAMGGSKEDYYRGIYLQNHMERPNDYLSAIEMLSAVLPEDINYPDAMEKVNTAYNNYISSVTERVDSFIQQGDLNSAISLLEESLQINGISEEMKAKLDEVIKINAESYAQKADIAFKNHDINTAIGNIKVAMELLPDNPEYNAVYNMYEQYIPMKLYQEDNIIRGDMGHRVHFDDEITAINDTKYRNCLYYEYLDTNLPSTIGYLLQGKYDTVTGVFFPPKQNMLENYGGSAYFKAYGDGKLLYTSPTITAESMPKEFEFSVSGIHKLEITFVSSGSTAWGSIAFDYAVISELTAQKNFPVEQ